MNMSTSRVRGVVSSTSSTAITFSARSTLLTPVTLRHFAVAEPPVGVEVSAIGFCR